MFNTRSFSDIPPVVKNLLILNVVMYLVANFVLPNFGINSYEVLGLFYPTSPFFEPWQLLSHMFMHGGFFHLLLNMFGLWMFGKIIEQVWGPKKFLFYYLFTGLGAAFFHIGIMWFQNKYMGNTLYLNVPMVGASGAVYGVLLAFGMLFPNTQLMLIFPPIPVKAKYLVMALAGFALFMGLRDSNAGGIAHFAHLGGMIFGVLLILIWKRDTRTLY